MIKEKPSTRHSQSGGSGVGMTNISQDPPLSIEMDNKLESKVELTLGRLSNAIPEFLLLKIEIEHLTSSATPLVNLK